MFPKERLFQIFKACFVDINFFIKIKAEDPVTNHSHAAAIIERQSGCFIQNSSNLKGLGRESCDTTVSRISRLWSELSIGR
jgi:hypothetical protein